MEVSTKAPPTARLFIGLPVPEHVVTAVTESFGHFAHVIREPVPAEKWHVTLAWLGEVHNPRQYYSRLTAALSLSFVPTVRLLHVGRGRSRQHLWAYADPSPSLVSLRSEFIQRLKKMRFRFPAGEPRDPFVPHITVAKLYQHAGGVGLSDYPVPMSFAVREALVYRSELMGNSSQYYIERRIQLT